MRNKERNSVWIWNVGIFLEPQAEILRREVGYGFRCRETNLSYKFKCAGH